MEQQPRDDAGRFGEKTGAAPEVDLSLQSEVARIREQYTDEWNEPWYYTGGDVWRVEVVSDPNDPTGQTPMQEQVLVASAVEDTAERIARQHNDIQTLLAALAEQPNPPF